MSSAVLLPMACCGGGADASSIRTCLSRCAYACSLLNPDQHQRTGPFGWSDQPEKNCACSHRVQDPGVSRGEINQPQGEENGWQMRRPYPPNPEDSGGGGEAQPFHRFSVGRPGSGLEWARYPEQVFLVFQILWTGMLLSPGRPAAVPEL